MFSVNILVRFKKSPFSIIKNLIEKGTIAGMLDFYTDLLEHLQSHFCSPPAKGKRHSRSKFEALWSKRCTYSILTIKFYRYIELSKASVLVTGPSTTLDSLNGLSKGPNVYDEISNDLTNRQTIITKELRRKSVVWFVIVVMCGITALNIGLFIKLVALEGSTTVYSSHTKTDLLLFAWVNCIKVYLTF